MIENFNPDEWEIQLIPDGPWHDFAEMNWSPGSQSERVISDLSLRPKNVLPKNVLPIEPGLYYSEEWGSTLVLLGSGTWYVYDECDDAWFLIDGDGKPLEKDLVKV
jgi:hypothetical protein